VYGRAPPSVDRPRGWSATAQAKVRNLRRRFDVQPRHAMTTHRKQYLSAFTLSAAALFLGGCKKPIDVKDPETTTGAADSAGVDAGGAIASGDENVKCFGINSCAGESVCAVNKPDQGIEHACAGENTCKNKGWIKVTRSECEAKAGEVLGTL
jgi:hypothetical protein